MNDFFDLALKSPWLFVLSGIVWVIVLILFLKDILKSNTTLSGGTKIVWVFVIILIPIIGMLIYAASIFKRKRSLTYATIIATVITIALVWVFIFFIPTTDYYRNLGKEKAAAVKAADLLQEFRTNEDSATKKYNNKVVDVTGVVQKIDADSTGTTILLVTNDSTANVSFRLKSIENDIKPGATVTIKGLFTGYIGDVQLNEATIVKK